MLKESEDNITTMLSENNTAAYTNRDNPSIWRPINVKLGIMPISKLEEKKKPTTENTNQQMKRRVNTRGLTTTNHV